MKYNRLLVDDGYDYDSSCVCQECQACGWHTCRGRSELEACPKCSAPIEPATSVLLGRTSVYYTGSNAHFDVVNGGPFASGITLQAADLGDILKFLARHVEPDSGRGLPNIHAIRREIHQALNELEQVRPMKVRTTLIRLLKQLDPRGAGGLGTTR